ncbi:MAG: hypothetical protein P8J18_09470 [Halieaceae bacterium]|nr:hypothetical protein [Halieaceae bacterium]
MNIRPNIASAILIFSLTISVKTFSSVPPDAQIYFDSSIAGLIEAPKCLGCHVSGGNAGTTRLVFQKTGTNKNDYNALQFYNLINSFNAPYILNKIKGINHGGGQQYSEISTGYQLFITFFELLEKGYGDDDGDGVGNTADLCPNTPDNTAVDATGCEIEDDIADTMFFATPGASCRAADPAKSIKLQSRESGLTNTDNMPLDIICPITIENNGGNGNEWKLYLNIANEGTNDFSISCIAYEHEGLTKISTIEKNIDLKGTNDNAPVTASLAWNANPSTNTTSYAISCALPSQGVIQSVTVNLK